MYAGATLARVGLDFRAALPPMFESRILALFTQVPAPHAGTLATSRGPLGGRPAEGCTVIISASCQRAAVCNCAEVEVSLQHAWTDVCTPAACSGTQGHRSQAARLQPLGVSWQPDHYCKLAAESSLQINKT